MKKKQNKKAEKSNLSYRSQAGREYAISELFQAVKKHIKPKAKILEVGCGYGRNLMALAKFKDAHITGIDQSQDDLRQAQALIDNKLSDDKDRFKLIEVNAKKLPFPDNSFDFVVLWQVMEHVYDDQNQEIIIAEISRVLKNGGLLLMNTPNKWFPIDYHDTYLPFIHWIFPEKWRQKICGLIRNEAVSSNYVSYPQFFSLFPSHIKAKKISRVYLYDSYRELYQNLSGYYRIVKKILFAFLFIPYIISLIVHIPLDAFLPSLRLLVRVNKSKK